jgi:hypothetical protein
VSSGMRIICPHGEANERVGIPTNKVEGSEKRERRGLKITILNSKR